MKRIVFLFCIFMMNVTYVNGEDTVCNGGYIQTEMIRENQVFGESITVTGSSPFNLQLLDESRSYYLNDFICNEKMIVGYGYTIEPIDGSNYDGLLVFIDKLGEITEIKRLHHGEHEEVVNVYFFDNTYIVEVVKSIDTGTFDFDSTILEFYDKDFSLSKVESLENRVIDYKISDQMILFNFDYDDVYDVGFSSNSTKFTKDSVLEIEEKYDGEAELLFMNDALLNDNIVEDGLLIDYPGYYTFVHNELDYEFVVEPIITGVEDKGIYDSEVRVQFNKGNALLNGEHYISNEVISYPGTYTLQISGVNDYVKEISFVVKPSISGIINGQTYNKPVILSFQGEGYLNSNLVTSPLNITDSGDYLFRLRGANGYTEDYEFRIIEENNNTFFDNFVSNLDILLVVVVVVSGVVILKKK